MTVSLVAAVAANGVIGDRGTLPWRLPDDLARFRRLTIGHTLIMGRRTFQSIGRPLKDRRTIVLSREAGLRLEGCLVVHSPDAAREAAADEPEVFVVGGSAIYRQFLPAAGRMYLTWIDREVPGDARFPEVDWDQWRIVAEAAGAPNADWPHRFIDYERRGPRPA
jgi:dihydrofolate reductase